MGCYVRRVFENVPEGTLTYKITTPDWAPRDEWGSLWVTEDLQYDVDLLDAMDVPERYALKVEGARLPGGPQPQADNINIRVPAGRMVVIENAGDTFQRWAGDIEPLRDPNSEKTYLIMPAKDVHIRAQ